MFRPSTIFLLAAFLIQTACVPSLNPIYTENDLVFDPSLLGVWTDDDKTETWEFTFADEKEYRLLHTDEQGNKGTFEARLVRIEGKRFLDIAPVRTTSSQNDFFSGHILSVHSFVEVSQDGKNFRLSYLEPKWLKPFLEKNPSAVRHAFIDGEVVFTDSSKNLQKFIAANLNSPGAFSSPISVKRKEVAR